MHTSYAFTIPMKERSTKNVMQAYLSNIFAHKRASIGILGDFKNTTLNEACNQLGIERKFSNPFHPQGNSRIESMHSFFKRTITKFWNPVT